MVVLVHQKRGMESAPAIPSAAVPTPNRSDPRWPLAVHESGHAVVGRWLGIEVRRLVIGDNWGAAWVGHSTAAMPANRGQFVANSKDVTADIVEMCKTAKHNLGPGETRDDASVWFLCAHDRLLEYLAGVEAEFLICPEAANGVNGAESDFVRASAFAASVCISNGSVRELLEFASKEVRYILRENKVALVSLAEALLSKSDLDSAEIDCAIIAGLIADGQRHEHERRSEWRARLDRAADFNSIANIANADFDPIGQNTLPSNQGT